MQNHICHYAETREVSRAVVKSGGYTDL